MDPTLHYKVHREGVNKQIIIKYNKPVKPYNFYYLATDHVWEN